MKTPFLITIVSAAAFLSAAHASVTYTYAGNTLSGAAPYGGASVNVTVALDHADVLPLQGSGGVLTVGSVEAFTATVDPTTTIDLGSASFWTISLTIEPDLSISEWQVIVERDLGRGNTNPENIITRFYDDGVTNDGDVVGDNDTFPNNPLWFLSPFAESTNPGSWTLDAIPEPAASFLMLGAIAFSALARGRRRESAVGE